MNNMKLEHISTFAFNDNMAPVRSS